MNKPSPLAVQAAPALSGSAVPSAPPRAPVPPVPSTESVPSDESAAPVESPPSGSETEDEIVARHRAHTRSPRRSECKSDAEYKQKMREWWERMGREAREASIRRGDYNPGNWPVSPDYEPDREKAMAELDAFREKMLAEYPGPHTDTTPYIRRIRELGYGHGCTEEELEEWKKLEGI